MYGVSTLEGEGLPPLEEPEWPAVEHALRQLSPDGRGYVILTADDGSYVQVAGSRQELTIEYRQTIGTRFRHFVLGKRADETSDAELVTSVGTISLRSNEVLTLDDALSVCRHFFIDGAVPEQFTLRETTMIFLTA